LCSFFGAREIVYGCFFGFRVTDSDKYLMHGKMDACNDEFRNLMKRDDNLAGFLGFDFLED
jgi:hypothetical protein